MVIYMIYDRIKNLSAYQRLPGIAIVKDFIENHDLLSLPAGKIPLGCGIYVNVNLYTPKDTGRYEAHRRFMDLQYVVSGEEDMYCVPLDCAIADAQDGVYQEEKDIQFFAGAKEDTAVQLPFHAGDFALFYPQDVHMPGIIHTSVLKDLCERDRERMHAADPVRKLVFKIPVPEYAHIAHVKDLCDAIALPPDASNAVIAAAERIPSETADAVTAAFFRDEDIHEKIEALAAALDITVPLCSLVLYLIFAKQTYENYREKGIGRDIYLASMTDFTVWNLACVRKTGAPGLLQTGWLENTLKEKLYRLGRFQYEPTTFAYDDYQCGAYHIHRGDPVITIHIPEGEPLTDDIRMDSYRRAEQFFGSHVFVCHSWLLYPAHKQFLQENSRIVRFMEDFVLLSAEERRGALDDLWRIYGFGCDVSDFLALPEHTGMQRSYKKHLLESGGMTGSGYGILIIEDGKIVNKCR